MTRLYVTLIAALTALLSFTSVSLAANAVDPADGSLDVAKAVYNAFAEGHKAYAAALLLVVAVAMVRKYLGGTWAWLHTDAGSAITVLVGSFGTALAASLAGGGPVTWHLCWAAATVAFAAAGGYTTVKKLIIMPLAPKLPSWLAGPILFLFQHASDPSTPKVAGNTQASPGA